MPSTTTKLVADGLWQRLCPSYNATAALITRNALVRQRRPALQGSITTARRPTAFRRNFSVSSNRRHDTQEAPSDPSQEQAPVVNAFNDWTPSDDKGEDMSYLWAKRPTKIRQKSLFTGNNFDVLSTPEVYELAREASGKGNNREARRLIEFLVRERKEQPNLRMYSILILANVHPIEGSARRVTSLLAEMEDQGLQMDSQICHDALQVLSVHLDYLLRSDILNYMRQRWLQLTPEGHHWVCAALFREAQLELGLDHLESMRREGIIIKSWLHDIAMYSLIEKNEFDETMLLVKERIAANDWSMSKALWRHILDRGSANLHHSATTYVWNSQVIPGYLIPSSGMCLNVLTTASRAGDAALATSVFQILGKRSTVFKQIHYDQLLGTYLASSPPDLRAAFTVLSIMSSVKIIPNAMSTRPILSHLRRHEADCEKAYDTLISLHEQGREIPVAALNVIIEAYVENNQLEQALVAYKHMHLFEQDPIDSSGRASRRRPFSTIETFNILLRGTSKQEAYETAMFLISEMLALGIRPDYLTYDRLIETCILSDQIDNAHRYFEEMDELEMLPRGKTVELLAKKLARMGDERCWDVLQRSQDRGNLDPKTKRTIEALWQRFEAGRFEAGRGEGGEGDGRGEGVEGTGAS